jgi:hypothetical protein
VRSTRGKPSGGERGQYCAWFLGRSAVCWSRWGCSEGDLNFRGILQGSNFYTVTLNSLFDRDEEKIVKIHEQGDTSIRKVAARFDVSKGFVQKILKQKQTTGHVQPKQLSWKS